jgi:hypothetical protein
MQSFFNPDDARLEDEAVISGNPIEKCLVNEYTRTGDETGKFFILVGLLVVFIFVLKSNLSSSTPNFFIDLEEKETISENKFTVEMIKPEIIKPKPKPKPDPPKEVETKKVRRRVVERSNRRAPEEVRRRVRRQPMEKRREIKAEVNRDMEQEQVVKRDMPKLTAPVIENMETVDRSQANEPVRQVLADISNDTLRSYDYGDIEVRHAPSMEISHSELDPYHYQMVDLCLRLCAQSLFLRQSASLARSDFGVNWLKIERGDGNNRMLILHKNTWLVLKINKDRLKVLSDLSFIEVPVNIEKQVGDVEFMFEDVTRKLCKLLKHEECLENL